MNMRCPNRNTILRIPDSQVGKPFRCPACGGVHMAKARAGAKPEAPPQIEFSIPVPPLPPQPEPPPAPPAPSPEPTHPAATSAPQPEPTPQALDQPVAPILLEPEPPQAVPVETVVEPSAGPSRRRFPRVAWVGGAMGGVLVLAVIAGFWLLRKPPSLLRVTGYKVLRPKGELCQVGIAVSLPARCFFPTDDQYKKMLQEAEENSRPRSPRHVKVYDPKRFSLILADGKKLPPVGFYFKSKPQSMLVQGCMSHYSGESPFAPDEEERLAVCFELSRDHLKKPMQIQMDQRPPVPVPNKEVEIPLSTIKVPKVDIPDINIPEIPEIPPIPPIPPIPNIPSPF